MKRDDLESVKESSPREVKFSSDILMLGFTGSVGSGCTYIAKGLKDLNPGKRSYFSLSQFIHDKAREQGIRNPTTDQLQDLGNKLRQEFGNSILALLCIKKAEKNNDTNKFSGDTILIFDGIRNDGEVKVFQQFPNFYLVSVHADKEIRKRRLVGKGISKKFQKPEDFEKADIRDQHEYSPYGQKVKYCNYLADVIIKSYDIPKKAEAQKRAFLERIFDRYILPMTAVIKRQRIFDRPPTVNETLMTMAYCISKRSRCQKRKVGAVVCYFAQPINNLMVDSDNQRINKTAQFQVVSVGNNDVPIGTEHCIFTGEGVCYREFLQLQHSKKLKYCPKCGKKIPKVIKCPYCNKGHKALRHQCIKCKQNLLDDYKCLQCKSKVFCEFLPGGKGTPTKLLDICKALHAEENALLGISGFSKTGLGELVIYTTTFPCNLCANKIVAAGIKHVFYAEPYPMKEARNILDGDDVSIHMFEGIKSTSYFRLNAL